MTSKAIGQMMLPADVGTRAYALIRDLYPICRSITGNGLRQTLQRIQREIPIEIHEVPTGTQVLDWTVPKEWNIRSAYIATTRGEKVIDFANHSLHILNYSCPITKRVTREELQEHLFTLPKYPDWIPYRTSYYKENWGFCLSDNQAKLLTDAEYDVVIDSSLEDGALSYGELLLPGESDEEVLISTHSCHPSLCNDNLSGVAVATYIAALLGSAKRRYSYRFLFIPGTIGSITWLARNEDKVAQIRHGMVLACVGDPGAFHYKQSRQRDAEIDRVVEYYLQASGFPYKVREFSPYGYDERQYCSPGFNLPVGCFSRTPHGAFPEYHTSADNLDFVSPEALARSLKAILGILGILEGNRTYLNTNPKGEPQLGKRGLYRVMGGMPDAGKREMAMLWVLNQSDGFNSLLDIAARANLPFALIADVAGALVEAGLLTEVRE
jgi:aminopeptidase-like protein